MLGLTAAPTLMEVSNFGAIKMSITKLAIFKAIKFGSDNWFNELKIQFYL